METQETPKPSKPVISQEKIMNMLEESAQRSPLISERNSEDSDEHISEPNPSPEEWLVPLPYMKLFNPYFDLNTLLLVKWRTFAV